MVDKSIQENSSFLSGFLLVGATVLAIIVGGTMLYAYVRHEMLSKMVVAEAIAEISPLREYVKEKGRFPKSLDEVGLPERREIEIGSSEPGDSVRAIREVKIKHNAVEITFSGLADQPQTLIMAHVAHDHWNCTGGSLDGKFRPSGCKGHSQK